MVEFLIKGLKSMADGDIGSSLQSGFASINKTRLKLVAIIDQKYTLDNS